MKTKLIWAKIISSSQLGFWSKIQEIRERNGRILTSNPLSITNIYLNQASNSQFEVTKGFKGKWKMAKILPRGIFIVLRSRLYGIYEVKNPGLIQTSFFANELCNPNKLDILDVLVKLDFLLKAV